MNRKLLIALSVGLLLLTVPIAYFVRLIIRSMPPSYEVPAELRKPRVVTGNNLFGKSIFYRGTGIGEISQILIGWPADREGAELVVAGNRGAQFLDLDGHLRKAIHFSESFFSPLQIVRLDASGNFGFLTRDESWSGPVLLFDNLGQEIWSYGSHIFSGADDSVAGDINGDGKLEFVVARNDKIDVISRDGHELWTSHDLNIWHLELLPAFDNEQAEILHSNAGGELIVQDPKGHEVARYLPGGYVGEFAITRWGAETQPTHILAPNEIKNEADPLRREFFILDPHGKIVSHFESPLGALLPRLKGTPVSFRGENSYYSLLQSYSPANRSLLSLFDGKSHLVYEEILDANCGAVASVLQGSNELLLVGCEDKIWAYALLPDTKDSSKRAD